MQQEKFSLTPLLIRFVCSYELYGFDSKSSMVRAALLRLKEEIEEAKLIQSADLYNKIYENDTELRELTETAIHGWPE